ncbi:MAG: YeeE/YedE family protein [Rhodothermales bacterium]|nr:YeeE/YedE family protein [Rhodothermales bacterium]
MNTKNLLLYLVVGVVFGVLLSKTEVISWYRIQEMFRFQSFHMYGIIGTAIVTAAASVRLLRAAGFKALDGSDLTMPPKEMGTGTRYWLGGSFFGIGWALTGACPGPLFALVGNGVSVYVVSILSALVGTWLYGHVRHRLPH